MILLRVVLKLVLAIALIAIAIASIPLGIAIAGFIVVAQAAWRGEIKRRT